METDAPFPLIIVFTRVQQCREGEESSATLPLIFDGLSSPAALLLVPKQSQYQPTKLIHKFSYMLLSHYPD